MSMNKIQLSDYIESVLIGKVEQIACLFDEIGISYIPINPRTGYQGLEIKWKKSKQIKFKGFLD